MDDRAWQQELTRRKRVVNRIGWATLSANGCGIVLTLLYFILTDTVGTQPAPDTLGPENLLGFWVSVLCAVVLLIFGFVWGNRRGKIVSNWYLGIGYDGPPPPASERVRNLALNQPAESALVSIVMWGIAGALSGLAVAVQLQQWHIVLIYILSIGIFSGSVVGILDYFLYERLWQKEIPLFFPEGQISGAPGLRLTVRRRILILFVMGAVPLPLLAVSTYTQAVAISQAAQPALLLSRLLSLELFLVGVGLLTAIVLGLTLGASFVEPIETLRRQMRLVQQGNLNVQAPVVSNDEFGEMAESFNAMTGGLRQEEVIRDLFRLYVTPEVADHAIAYGAELGGQLAETSVLFSDIRGFTSMTERMAPDALIALLNRYFNAMSAAVIDEGGLINKFGGDSLLAVFGTPLNPTPDHAAQAVRATQGMLAALDAFNTDQEARNEPALRIGIGVATGAVVAGNVGSEERLEYTVIGDTVNLASRLQSLTKELSVAVLLSETTVKAAGDLAAFNAIGTVEVRGKQAPVAVYTLWQ
ncbi:MAG: adenylate/guanylate cyclase domain-containing protein [Anaerolineae bacterium]|nr:adenylate/guanylate cyclase domain-containing protein [Anaerolineae bacterium]